MNTIRLTNEEARDVIIALQMLISHEESIQDMRWIRQKAKDHGQRRMKRCSEIIAALQSELGEGVAE